MSVVDKDDEYSIFNTQTLKPEAKKANPIHILQDRIQAQENLIERLIADAAKKEETFHIMEKRIRKLEADQIEMNSMLFLKDNVATLLSQRVAQLEQYTRRPSVIIKGIPVDKNEQHNDLTKIVQDVVEKCQSETSMVDVDKFHRNGQKDGDNQDIIIRFKSHSAKEEFYAKLKTIPSSSRIKVQPSLSPETKKLLSASSDYVDDFKSYNEVAEGEKKMKNCPDFTFADVHGNLLVKFSERTADGMFFRYNSMQQLSLLIQKYNEREDAENEFAKTMEPDYMWNGTNWVFTLKP
jgi:hypothetical protein